jgi:putative transposase
VLVQIQSLNHSTYQHQYHLVWGTKYRRKWIKPYVKADLLESLYTLEKHYPTIQIQVVNTDEDHIHLSVTIPPDIAVSKAVQLFKQNSSRVLRKKFGFIRRMYLEDSIWAVGYFSSTIGLNEEQIKKYIEHQGKEELPQQVTLWSA